MATSFAGARNLDDRRRRRIATETEENSVSSARRSSTVGPAQEQRISREQVSIIALFPVRKLISPQIWKLTAFSFALFLLGGLLLTAGLKVAENPAEFGPGFSRLFSLESGRAINYFCGILMTLAGQVAILIWWARSRSLHDYDGNFRVWVWTATCAIMFGFCLLTDAHIAFSLTVFWFWDLNFWKQDTLCWLGPALIITGGIFWQLRHDLYDCKSSRSFYVVAAGCWVVSALLNFDMQFPSVNNQQAAHAVVAMIGSVMFFMSMLFHARFVLYESAEAPAAKPKNLIEKLKSYRLFGILGAFSPARLLPSKSTLSRLKPRLPKRKKKEKQPVAASAKKKLEQKKEMPAEERPKPKRKAKAEPKPRVAEPTPVVAEEPPAKPAKKPRFRLKSQAIQEAEPQPEPAPAPKPQQPKQTQPVQQQEEDIESFPIDDEFAGLSRKERRRLRKQRQKQSRKAS